MFSPSSMIKDLKALRESKPLVTNITNYVVTNSTANALLAIGASPIMTHAVEEVEDLVNISSALVINLGTVARSYLEAMPPAWGAANKNGIPVVLDPVGAGASRVRTEAPSRMLSMHRPSIIRGNASEIMTLAGEAGEAKGVDSAHGSDAAELAARVLAGVHKCTVVVSGEVDLITDGEQVIRVAGGSAMMPLVTGLGCTATAICGAFAAVSVNPFEAAVYGMAAMNVAGEMAAEKAQGPGTLQLHLYDALYSMNADDIEQRLRITH